MGIIIGKFRKKKSTYDILEKLENQITSIEEFSRSTEQFRKKVIARFILLAVLFYFILACLLYFYYERISSNRKFAYFIPLIALPFIIWIIKKFLAWYYTRKLQLNEKKLVKLKEEKKKMLENVMETETYKVAKKILDKFGNEKKQLSSELPLTANLIARSNQTGLRQRQSLAPQISKTRLSFGSPQISMDKSFAQPTSFEKGFHQTTPLGFPSRPSTALPTTRLGPHIPSSSQLATTPQLAMTPQIASASLSLPRSILPSNRSVLDKMVDYLVGDGPSNRYALICKKCSNHNGMALKEEFEYLSFRCCYCSHFNPSKKKRLSGPKFEVPQALKITQLEDTSESDKDTADSEPEVQAFEKRRSSSERNISKSGVHELTRHSSSPEPEKSSDFEKNSDFDKLSDFDYRESGESNVKSPGLENSEFLANPFSVAEFGEAALSIEECRKPFSKESFGKNPFSKGTFGENPFSKDSDSNPFSEEQSGENTFSVADSGENAMEIEEDTSRIGNNES